MPGGRAGSFRAGSFSKNQCAVGKNRYYTRFFEQGETMIRSFRGVSPRIGANSYIDESAVVIGDVETGEHCSVWPLTVIRGDTNSVRIGSHTNIQDGSVLHVTHDGEF